MAEYARLVIAADSRQIRDAERDLSLLERQSGQTESAVVGMAARIGVAFAGLKLADRAKDAVLLASRYEQMGLVMETVGRNAGRSTVELAALDQMLQETGISALQSRNNLIRMMSANIDLAQATKLARLAQDAAVIGNLNSSEAFERLITGIQTAQVETLRNLGLNVNFANSYEQLAGKLGTTSDALTEQQRVQARTNAAMEAGANIAGTYAASMENAGKQLGSTERHVENLKIALGSVWQDDFRSGVKTYSAALGLLGENAELVAETLRVGVYVAAGRATAAILNKGYATAASAYATRGQVVEELKAAQAHAASTAAALTQARAYAALGGSTSQLTALTVANEAAQRRLVAAQAATAMGARTAAAALSLIGGPLGAAMIAYGAVYYFREELGLVPYTADKASESLERLADGMENLDKLDAIDRISKASESLEKLEKTSERTEAEIERLQERLAREPETDIFGRTSSTVIALRERIERLTHEQQKNEREAQKHRNTLAQLDDVVREANEGYMTQEQILDLLNKRHNTSIGVTGENTSAIEKITERLEAEHRQLTMSTRGLLEYNLAKAGALPETVSTALALHDQNEALRASAVAQKEATEETKRSDNAYQSLLDSLYPAEAAQREYRKEVESLETRLSGDKLADAIHRLNKRYEESNPDSRALKEYQRELQRLEDRLNPAGRAAREFAEEQAMLRAEIERSGDPTGRYTELLAKLEDEYRKNSEATNEWAQWTESALERVDSAFADAWRNISDGFSSFRDNLTNAFKQMLAELAHMAITRPIVLQLGAAMGIGPGTQGNNGIWGSSSSGGGIGDMFTMASIGKLAQTGWSGIKGLATGQGLSGFGGMLGSQITSPVLSEAAFSQIALEQGLSAAYAADIGAGAGTSMAASFKSGIADVLKNLKGAASNPVTWIAAGMIASNQLYGAGVRASGSRTAEWAEDSSALGKVAWAPFTAGSYAVEGMDKLIGSIFGGRLTAIATGSPVFQAVNDVIGRAIFGNQEQFKRTVGSAQGVYAGGEYTGMGAIESFYGGSRRFGDDFDAALHDMNAMFTAQLGGLFDVFGLESDITTETTARLRRTSGRLVGSLTASFEDAVINVSGQYAKKGRIEEGMQQFFDEVMGKGFVEAIAASSLPEYLKELTAGLTDAEEVGVTISGLLQRFGGVNDVLSTISIALLDTSDAGLRAADSILALMGGIDSLAGSASVYRDRFFSEAEKMELTISSVARTFDEAGIVLATSRQGYREMVDNIDLTTEAGHRMFATLMALAGEADAYYSALEARSAQMLGAVGAAFSSLQRSIAAQQQRAQDAYAARIGSLNDMASTASANINEMVRVSNALDTAMRRLRGTSDETVRSLQAQAVMRLNSILMSGRPLSQFDDLQDALDTASKVDPALYASLEEFERTQGRTANLIARLEEINGKQLSTEERLLNAVQAQIRAAEQQHERQMSALSMQLSYAQAQLDALNGLDSTIMGVTQAVNAMNAAMVGALKSMPSGSAKANTPANNKTIVDTLYETILGREADGGGRVYWQYQLQSGALDYSNVSETLARAAIENPDETAASKQAAREFLRNQGIPGFASGGYHTGGLRIVGERGPELEATGPARIYNAQQTAEMIGGGQAARETAELRKAVERQGDALRSIAKHTMQTARRVEFLERWDYDGMPEERKLA